MLRILTLLMIVIISSGVNAEETGPSVDQVLDDAKQWIDDTDIVGDFKKALKDSHNIKIDSLNKTLGKMPEIANKSFQKAKIDIQKLLQQGNKVVEAAKSEISGEQKDEPEIFILISMTMPKDVLKTYAVQSAKIQAPLVLRGLVGGKMRKTQQAIVDILGTDPDTSIKASFAIDPTSFSRFEVDRVPAIIVTENTLPVCTKANCPVPEHYAVYGDVSISYALNLVSRESKKMKEKLKPIISKLEGES